MLLLLFLIFYPTLSHAQFAEIASLATSLLGSGLGGALGGAPALAGLGASAGSAASQGGGALAQIGQLYQLAQGALQLTGTGVGVLNQASEGNWFPAALEQAAKNSKALGMGGLSGMPDLGALGGATRGTSGSQIGSEFGTGFPAPDIDDYNDNTDKETKANPKTPMGLVNIDDKDYDLVTSTTPNTTVTTTVPITLFPDENLESQTDSNVVIDLTTQSPMKQIRIELPKRTNANTSELDYIDEVIAEGKSQVQITTKTKNDNDENLIKPDRTAAAPTLLTKTRSIPSLAKLIDVLRKSSLKEAEIMEIITQVEGNEQNTSPHKTDFSSAVQNISDKKFSNRARIVEASRQINNNWRSNYDKPEAPRIEKIPRFSAVPLTVVPSIPSTFYSQVSTVPPPIHHYQLPEHPLTNARGPAPPTVDMLQLSRMQREIGSVPVSKGTQIPHYQPPPQATNTWQAYHPQLQNVLQPQTINQPIQQYQQHVQQPYYNRMPQPQYHPTNYQPNRVPPSPFPPSPPPPPHPYPGQQVQQPRSYYQYRQFQQVSGQAYSQESATRNANFNQPNSAPMIQQHQLAPPIPKQLGQAVSRLQINSQAQGQMNMPYRSITGNLPTDYYKAKGSAYINQRVSQAPRDQNHEMLRNFHDSTIRTTQSAGANEGERYQRADVTRLPTRRFPTRTARTLPLTTPPSVRGVAAINQLPNQQLTKRFVHSN